MLVLDDALLGDYLDGTPGARTFLETYEEEVWAVPVPVLYGACMASLHGHIDGSPGTVRRAVTMSMDVLDVTGRTVAEAVDLQAELLERGVPAAPPDVLVAASAREHGGTLETAEEHFRQEEVGEVLSVATYEPY